MVCLSGADDTKGSTPRAAVAVVTLINEAKTNRRRDSVRGDSFMVSKEKVGKFGTVNNLEPSVRLTGC